MSGVNVNFTLYGSTAGDTTSVDNGSFSQSSLGLGIHTLTYSKSGYLDAVLSDTLESDGQTLVVETVRLLPDSCTSGTMSGYVVDAVTADNMSGVGLWWASGMNKDYYIHTDEFTYYGKVDENGAWSLNKSAGWYTINSWKSGYYDGYVNIFACGDQPNQDNTLSAKLNPGEMRIVVKWPKTSPATAVDLDAHLFIPYDTENCATQVYDGDSDNSSKCHLWYRTNYGTAVNYTGVNTYDYHEYTDIVGTGDWVTLDRDEKVAPGIETISISKVRSGTYSFSVHNYTHKSKSSTDAESKILRKSRAKVYVYYNSGSKVYRKRFHAPNDNGTLWTVFTFDKDVSNPFTRVRTLSYQTTPANIY